MFTSRPAILQVIPRLEEGGAERTTIEIAEALVKAGARALVASEGGRLEQVLAEVGGELVRLPLASKAPHRIWLNAGGIAELAAREGVGLIHARSRAPAWSAYWATQRLQLPFVTTYHGAYAERGGLKRRYNSVMAKGDRVIANSEFTAGLICPATASRPKNSPSSIAASIRCGSIRWQSAPSGWRPCAPGGASTTAIAWC